MGLVRLYATPKTNSGVNDTSQNSSSRCYNVENSSFCRCHQDMQRTSLEKQKSKYSRRNYLNTPRAQLLPDTSCRCGEDACRIINWTWDKQNLQPQIIINNTTVQFHPIYSQGILHLDMNH